MFATLGRSTERAALLYVGIHVRRVSGRFAMPLSYAY